jgi:hypothetical protein
MTNVLNLYQVIHCNWLPNFIKVPQRNLVLLLAEQGPTFFLFARLLGLLDHLALEKRRKHPTLWDGHIISRALGFFNQSSIGDGLDG